MLVVTEHTDWQQQREFQALSVEDKLLQIWLNGRETNGKVADAIRDIEEDRVKDGERDKRLSALERWVIGVSAVGVFVLAAAPFVFFGIDRIIK